MEPGPRDYGRAFRIQCEHDDDFMEEYARRAIAEIQSRTHELVTPFGTILFIEDRELDA